MNGTDGDFVTLEQEDLTLGKIFPCCAKGDRMSDKLKLYDGHWLKAYWAAKDVIARVSPGTLEAFVESFAVLRTDPIFTPKNLTQAFDPAALAGVKETIRSIPKEKFEMHELERFGRFVVHNYPAFTDLHQTLVDSVSEWAGEEVEPSYNFLSMYTKRGICEPHLDNPTAKWTLDVCIDQSEPWPIYFSQILPWPEERVQLGDDWRAELKSIPNLAYEAQVLMPGDAVLFSGSSQWHYRDSFPATAGKRFCDLLFFHFFPKGAANILKPKNWASHFGIPELLEIPEVY